MSSDSRNIVVAGLAGAVAATAGLFVLQSMMGKAKGKSGKFDREVQEQRSQTIGVVGRWTKPVVIAAPGLEALAVNLRKRLGCEEFSDAEGPTLSLERFKSNDPNLKFHWQRVIGRKIIFLFDTVDQSRLFEQLSLLQALQGFAVPDGDDNTTKWKSYVDQGKYSWGRASHITVVLPWYRPCQMERTSRWGRDEGGKWTNSDEQGQWLDVPTAQYMARLLSTPGSVPPLPGPNASLDGMPLMPLWRPPLELLFLELHEEKPISHSVSDLGAKIRMERFVPYFLDKYKAEPAYPGVAKTFVLFPDHGAYVRYVGSVQQRLKLDPDHILFINKVRIGETTEQEQQLFYQIPGKPNGKRDAFAQGDEVVIIDDFTNSGGTLFGAVKLLQSMVGTGKTIRVTIYVTHLVATYDPKVVQSIKEKLTGLGTQCRFVTTNTIPSTTDLLRDHSQVEVLDVSNLIADVI